MPIGKSINKNKKLGDEGELVTQEHFGLVPTSGSGCGRFDKQDSKNDWLRVETKATGKDHYVLNFKKFTLWRQQAAKDRKQFFLHLIPKVNGKLSWRDSVVICTEIYYKSLGGDCSTGYNALIEGTETCKIYFEKIGAYRNWSAGYVEIHNIKSDKYWPPLIAVLAPEFKKLLDKDNDD